MKVLELERVGQRLRAAKRVVYLCGAGLSVPSGIRAYRSGPNAMWDEYVTDWGTAERFRADPAAWWCRFWLEAHRELVSPSSGRAFQPNPGHRALARLAGRAPGDLLITQNIDGLHRLAGHPEQQLIEIHGRHDRFVCAGEGGCEGVDHPASEVDLSRVAQGVFPACGHCGAPMRPLVLLFDELYDSHPAFQAFRARRALGDADALVFVGTSFSVGITSYAVRCVAFSGPFAVNVNVEPAPFPNVFNLLGGAEVTLPALADAVLGTAGR